MQEVQQRLAAGDVAGAVRALRSVAEGAPVRDLGAVMSDLAAAADFDDLVAASQAVVERPEDPKALTVFGYECVERGVSFVAIPVLREALRLDPVSRPALNELVTAFEDEFRHRDAVEVLQRHRSILQPWPDRYLLVYNSLLSGDVAGARAEFDQLPAPEEDGWYFALDRVGRMLQRAELARTVTELDHQDLRGWQFALTGGYLGTLSPYGFDAGMTGRWAYLGDNVSSCRYSLDRLALILNASGRAPRTLSLLPGRSEEILGLAAAELLGLPIVQYAPDRTDTIVVAYDLNELDGDLAATLRVRAEGQILFEHATCWTQSPTVAADISGLLRQTVVAPWGPRQRMGDNGLEQVPADARTTADIAADIVRADRTPDTGDGATPPDPDSTLNAFVAATRDTWLTGPRTPMSSPGPVRSSSFG